MAPQMLNTEYRLDTWKERDPSVCVFSLLSFIVCYSDHQGQASAKRQGKFKKVLDGLEFCESANAILK